jgi:8-oxo-dGTP diphosphatase
MEPGTINAVGVWFYSQNSQRYLYLLRQDHKNPNTWGLPGGKVEPGESLMDAIHRECQEEIGMMPGYEKLIPLEHFTSSDGTFCYHTFFCCVDQEFKPNLNNEHHGYAWIDGSTWPRPMHPGLWSMVNFDVILDKINRIRSRIQTSQ